MEDRLGVPVWGGRQVRVIVPHLWAALHLACAARLLAAMGGLKLMHADLSACRSGGGSKVWH